MHVGSNVYCDKAEAKLNVRAGHRFYIERDGTYFNMLNVHRFPKKKFLRYDTYLKLRYGIIPVVLQERIAVVPLLIFHILITIIMFNTSYFYANGRNFIFRLDLAIINASFIFLTD